MAALDPPIDREALCRGHYELPGLTIQVEHTITLIPEQDRECPAGFLFKHRDGRLIAGGVPSGDGAMSWRASRDAGQSWEPAPAWPTYQVHQFDDGDLVGLEGSEDPWLGKTDRAGVYLGRVLRSTDGGQSFTAETVEIFGIPPLSEAESERSGRYVDSYVDHNMVALSDGSLLAGAHGRFAGNRKQSTYVLRSVDRGRSWHYRATVAADLTPDDHVRIEGFDEPALLTLPSGEVLCFMRSGGRYDGRHSPLYLSRSADDGRTWGVADPIADRGVWPNACRMASGVLAVVYGRPGDWLAFSLDDGHSWIGHFCLHLGPQPWDCGSYDWVEEVAPDTLLAAYGRTDPNNPRMSEVSGTYITVTRT